MTVCIYIYIYRWSDSVQDHSGGRLARGEIVAADLSGY